jgi:hypothetical protein
MDAIETIAALREARKRIVSLEETLRAEQSRLSRAQARIVLLERSLRESWARSGTVQGRR